MVSAPAVTSQLMLAPLRGVYAIAGRRLPHWEALSPGALPEPQRTLLVHQRDMTRTLEQFHRGPIHLRVFANRHDADSYWRESALELDDSGLAVEYGAIQIFLDRFAEPWRSQILGEHLPLGRILNESGMHYTSCPSAYFCCTPDAFIRTALRLDPERPMVLYGRQNTLTRSDGRPLAEIVEILPPG